MKLTRKNIRTLLATATDAVRNHPDGIFNDILTNLVGEVRNWSRPKRFSTYNDGTIGIYNYSGSRGNLTVRFDISEGYTENEDSGVEIEIIAVMDHDNHLDYNEFCIEIFTDKQIIDLSNLGTAVKSIRDVINSLTYKKHIKNGYDALIERVVNFRKNAEETLLALSHFGPR